MRCHRGGVRLEERPLSVGAGSGRDITTSRQQKEVISKNMRTIQWKGMAASVTVFYKLVPNECFQVTCCITGSVGSEFYRDKVKDSVIEAP